MYYTVISSKYMKAVTTKFGEFSAYEIVVADKEGMECPCQLLQKPETNEPMEGDKLHGYIEETQYGFKFKKTQPEDGTSPTVSKSHPATSPAAPGNNDTQNQIIRQSSLKVAADLVIASDQKDRHPNRMVSLTMELARYLAYWAETGKSMPTESLPEAAQPSKQESIPNAFDIDPDAVGGKV
jgi:hypothetical protein